MTMTDSAAKRVTSMDLCERLLREAQYHEATASMQAYKAGYATHAPPAVSVLLREAAAALNPAIAPAGALTAEMIREAEAHCPIALAPMARWDWLADRLSKALAEPGAACSCCGVTADGAETELFTEQGGGSHPTLHAQPERPCTGTTNGLRVIDLKNPDGSMRSVDAVLADIAAPQDGEADQPAADDVDETIKRAAEMLAVDDNEGMAADLLDAYETISQQLAATIAERDRAVKLIDWRRIEEAARQYVEEYEMVGEDEHGREGVYTPTDKERVVILDAMFGLFSDDDFNAAIAAGGEGPA